MTSTDLLTTADANAGRLRSRRAPLAIGTVVVIVVGAAITTALSLSAYILHENNEERLLRQRVREAAAVASAAIPNTQIPLASAAVLAEATNGDPAAFRRFVDPIIAAGRPFQSVSLWSTNAASAKPLVVVGRPPALASQTPTETRAFLDHAIGSPTTSLFDLLDAPDRRLGYALTVPTKGARYVVYGEASLPRNRRARIDSNSAFADFDYALFVGTTPDPTQLLASSTGGAALKGRRASTSIAFGDTKMLVVMSPRSELGGSLLANLWWLLLLLGLSLTAAAAALVERVSRRRRQAEQLADENAELYASQRSVALELQHSLLAEDFPDVAGTEIGARYVAGTEGIDIGGDWYDVVTTGDHRLFVAVGDVSGRGLQAATTMAALRFAIRAYAADGDRPGAVLKKLSALVSVGREGHFATALCAEIDLRERTVTVANAGHLEPLLVTDGTASFVTTTVGLPVGVRAGAAYSETTSTLPPSGTLLFFTDGLVERRGEILDEGLARLADAARAAVGGLEVMLSTVLEKTIPDGSSDDTALLGITWH